LLLFFTAWAVQEVVTHYPIPHPFETVEAGMGEVVGFEHNEDITASPTLENYPFAPVLKLGAGGMINLLYQSPFLSILALPPELTA